MAREGNVSKNVQTATHRTSQRIMTILDGLSMRQTPLESINTKTMAKEIMDKTGLKFTQEETKQIEERFSSIASSMWRSGKIKRTSKRINSGMFGYYTMQPIRAGDTLEDRIAKADAVEQEQYAKLTSLKKIKELLPNLKDHELAQVMSHIGMMLEDRNTALHNTNAELTEKLTVAEGKVSNYEEKILPLVEELDLSTSKKKKTPPKPQLQAVG